MSISAEYHELPLSFDCPEDADGLDFTDFFDDETGAYCGPCPVTGVNLLLDGKPIAEGWIIPMGRVIPA